jgi:hypothetical protein
MVYRVLNTYNSIKITFMRPKAFHIQFSTNEIRTVRIKSAEPFTYKARITTISESFKLFKVSGIKRITEQGMERLHMNYLLTAYPFPDQNDGRWKDAVTFSTNTVLDIIGNTIDSYFNGFSKSPENLTAPGFYCPSNGLQKINE